MTTFQAIKKEYKVAIPLEHLIKKILSNEEVSYTLVSLISHDGDSLDCGQYVSDVFDFNTGIFWHCDDANITGISDVLEGVYPREIQNQKKGNLCQSLKTYCM